MIATLLLAAKVGVICAGSQAGCSAGLPAGVEARLRLVEGVTIVDARELAAGIGARETDADAARLERVRGLLAEAEKEYFAVKLPQALATLSKAEEQMVAFPAAATDLPRLYMLRAMVKLKSGESERARATEDITLALRINPDLAADDYPPSIATLMDEVRSGLPMRAPLRVVASPAGVETLVDGRVVKGVVAVLRGRHQLVARGPGLRTVTRTFEVTDDEPVVRVSLTPVLPDDLSPRVPGLVFGDDTKEIERAMAPVLASAGVETLVVIAVRPRAGGAPAGGVEARAAVVSRQTVQTAILPLEAGGDSAALADAIAAALPLAEKKGRVSSVPAAATRAPPPSTAARPLTRRPVFWGAIGAGLVAVAAGVAAASLSGSSTSTTTTDSPGATTFTWNEQ